MAFCKKCGAEISDQATICPQCGEPQVPRSNGTDRGGLLWGLLGCCIPLVGLILFLLWRDTRPNAGRAAGIGALVGAAISAVCGILTFVTGIGTVML